MDQKPTIKKESKNKIRVEFERTDLKERLKAKFLSLFFLKRVVWFIFRLALLIGIAFVVIQPFITMITQSIMAPQDIGAPDVINVPRNLSLGIYKAIIVDANYFGIFIRTLGLSLLCALLQTFSCCLVGYGLAKFKFRGAKVIFIAVIITLAIPHGTLQAAISHHFRYFDIFGIFKFLSGGASVGVGWIDNILSKITLLPERFQEGLNLMESFLPLVLLSVTALAFKNGLYIFMLRQFFRGVPDELEESAYLDGANTFRTFIQVILPLSVPMMITVFLFAFCWQWTDDFYIPMFYTSGDANPLLMTYITESKLSSLSIRAAANEDMYLRAQGYGLGLMACTPLIILFLFCQRHLVQGIERSGIVG